MFFEGNRIDAMREMILADNLEDRKNALAKLLPYQRDDFVGIFTALKGLPATIRFLDPPLHEFLPHDEAQRRPTWRRSWASRSRKSPSACTNCTSSTRCSASAAAASASRIPEITEMQARAVFEAAAEVQKGRHQGQAGNHDPARRFHEGTAICRSTSSIEVAKPKCRRRRKSKLNYLRRHHDRNPARRARRRTRSRKDAEFFSFGTNDLTQTALGMSRDDSGSFPAAPTRNWKS